MADIEFSRFTKQAEYMADAYKSEVLEKMWDNADNTGDPSKGIIAEALILRKRAEAGQNSASVTAPIRITGVRGFIKPGRYNNPIDTSTGMAGLNERWAWRTRVGR